LGFHRELESLRLGSQFSEVNRGWPRGMRAVAELVSLSETRVGTSCGRRVAAYGRAGHVNGGGNRQVAPPPAVPVVGVVVVVSVGSATVVVPSVGSGGVVVPSVGSGGVVVSPSGGGVGDGEVL
jgi:hypothetical protein